MSQNMIFPERDYTNTNDVAFQVMVLLPTLKNIGAAFHSARNAYLSDSERFDAGEWANDPVDMKTVLGLRCGVLNATADLLIKAYWTF
jgi:hypothetical protein